MKREVSLEGLAYIDRVMNRVSSISEAYYQGKTVEARDLLNQLIEGLNWLEQMAVAFEMNKTPEQETRIIRFLDRMNDAVAVGDWVAIIDIIDYELEQVLHCYRDLFRQSLEAEPEAAL